jgi:hypothetical protein
VAYPLLYLNVLLPKRNKGVAMGYDNQDKDKNQQEKSGQQNQNQSPPKPGQTNPNQSNQQSGQRPNQTR